jgi:hypothetical protein
MMHKKLNRPKYDKQKPHLNFEWYTNIYDGEHSSYNGDNEVRLSNLLRNKNYTMVEFLMKNNALLFDVRDLLSLDKSNFVLKPRSNSTNLHRDSRHMTTDTTTILGFLTLGKFSLDNLI